MYAWNGKCYPDTATALNAFALAVPQADPVGITSFTAAPTINATGLITWSISQRPLTATTATTRTGTTQLPACTYGLYDKFALIPTQDILVSLGFAVCFVIGMVFGGRH